MARLFTYQCAFESLVWPFSIFAKQSSNPMHCAPFALSASAIIVNVLVDQFVTSSSQGCASFFKDRDHLHDSWITNEEFCQFILIF